MENVYVRERRREKADKTSSFYYPSDRIVTLECNRSSEGKYWRYIHHPAEEREKRRQTESAFSQHAVCSFVYMTLHFVILHWESSNNEQSSQSLFRSEHSLGTSNQRINLHKWWYWCQELLMWAEQTIKNVLPISPPPLFASQSCQDSSSPNTCQWKWALVKRSFPFICNIPISPFHWLLQEKWIFCCYYTQCQVAETIRELQVHFLY